MVLAVSLTMVLRGQTAMADEGVRRLNNLVVELLSVEGFPAGATEKAFALPREGWVFAGLETRAGEEVALGLDAAPMPLPPTRSNTNDHVSFELMHYLAAGQHTIRTSRPAGGAAARLVVRAIPDLVYSRYGSDPQVSEFGKFDRAYMERHVLPNINCMVGPADTPDVAFLERWKSAGRRYLVEAYAKPWFEKWPADRAFQYWLDVGGFMHPLVDGMIADEFWREKDRGFDAVTESLRRMRADERTKGKRFCPYCTSLYGDAGGEAFLRQVMAAGDRFAWERYLSERPTLEESRRHLQSVLVDEARKWAEHIPGSIEHMIVCFGHLMTAPPESVNTDPAVDQKYYMDMQFNLLANDPAFRGVGGVMEYLSSYADEEYVRWAMRLYRHYCIEGRTAMLSDAFGYGFRPEHIVNADFEDGAKAWTLDLAGEGTISTGRHEGYSWLEGRYPRTATGDTFLLMTRSAERPNRASQPVRGLKPGRLYALKMYTGDYGDLKAARSNRQTHALSIRIDGGEIVPDRSFQHVFGNCYSHSLGRFNSEYKYWMNYHQQVFRAKAETATLTLSDWRSEGGASGPVGQQLIFNFVEVQPYYDESTEPPTAAALGTPATMPAREPPAREALWRRLEKYFQPPAEYADKFGSYRSPLKFANGSLAKSPEDWARRRQEILTLWQRRLGPWPPLVECPKVERLESVHREGHTQTHVHVQISPEGRLVDGYLLVPAGSGPFPAVLVPFYEPLTSIGQGERGRGTHDYGLQLVRRGFVTLSIGTPGSVEDIGLDTRELLVKAGARERRQPLTLLAYAAANCHTALAQMPNVDPSRIGIIGLSYGGKWSMFASCLYDKFACAVWSDPGIVFNEKDPNVNYWEPWYLGYHPGAQRRPGVPSAANPRTGLYKELMEQGEDLVDLHALMAPRPVLVSGGVQDPPRNWVALNHLIAVNEVLGQKGRVAMTARTSHVPTAEALELELAFLEYWLKYGGE